MGLPVRRPSELVRLRRVEKAAAQLEDSLKWLDEHGTTERVRELVGEILRPPGAPLSFDDLVGHTVQLGAIADAHGVPFVSEVERS